MAAKFWQRHASLFAGIFEKEMATFPRRRYKSAMIHRPLFFLVSLATIEWFVSISSLQAAVQLNALFSENAVLQQGMPIPVWGMGKEGEAVHVSLAGQNADTVVKEGRWVVKIPAQKAGGPYALAVKGENELTVQNVWVGEVWICSGQSNMERQLGPRSGQQLLVNWEAEAASASMPLLRHFALDRKPSDTPLAETKGKWEVCTPQSVVNFTAVGYYFGRDLVKHLNVAVGLIHTSWGGTPAEAWTRHEALEESMPEILQTQKTAVETYAAEILKYQAAEPQLQVDWQKAVDEAKLAGLPEPKKPTAPRDPSTTPNRPSCLFNGMVSPIIPYAVRGVIWYQGEANVGRPLPYRKLFPLMISDWRKQWGEGEFPFLFVQLAPHRGTGPAIRESQLLTWKNTPQTAMVVTTDVGDANDIHPNRKEPVGQRLALAARAVAYGEKLEYSGPCFESAAFADGHATLSFSHAESGLMAQEKDALLTGFEIAGADQVFHPATAVIEDKTVVASSPLVATPVAMRYGWANTPVVNLANLEGLPASPFRTDDWDNVRPTTVATPTATPSSTPAQ